MTDDSTIPELNLAAEMERLRITALTVKAERDEAIELLARTLDLREMGCKGPHKEAIRKFLRKVWKQEGGVMSADKRRFEVSDNLWTEIKRIVRWYQHTYPDSLAADRNFHALMEAAEAPTAVGQCPKCGMGPMRESCAYPEACEHPCRELALKLNQVLLQSARVAAEDRGQARKVWKQEGA